MGFFTYNDTIVQMANCSCKEHMQEIVGTLIVGSSIIMLRPHDIMDIEYVLKSLNVKQVSYMHSLPAYLSYISKMMLKHNHTKIRTLRSLNISGKLFANVFNNWQYVSSR